MGDEFPPYMWNWRRFDAERLPEEGRSFYVDEWLEGRPYGKLPS